MEPAKCRQLDVYETPQTLVLVGVNTAISVLTDDCLSTLLLTLGSVTTLFMAYFAIEAVRTENRYQLAAYVVTSAVFLSGYVPPLVGSSDGPAHVHEHKRKTEAAVRHLILAALVATVTVSV